MSRRLGMMAWYSSEGGRKCVWCGKYRKEEDLVETSGTSMAGESPVNIESPPVCKKCLGKMIDGGF